MPRITLETVIYQQNERQHSNSSSSSISRSRIITKNRYVIEHIESTSVPACFNKKKIKKHREMNERMRRDEIPIKALNFLLFACALSWCKLCSVFNAKHFDQLSYRPFPVFVLSAQQIDFNRFYRVYHTSNDAFTRWDVVESMFSRFSFIHAETSYILHENKFFTFNWYFYSWLVKSINFQFKF